MFILHLHLYISLNYLFQSGYSPGCHHPPATSTTPMTRIQNICQKKTFLDRNSLRNIGSKVFVIKVNINSKQTKYVGTENKSIRDECRFQV